MSNENKLPKLRDEVAKEYEATIQPTVLHRVKLKDGKRVSVDMPNLSLAKANDLVEKGFPYLKKKGSSSSTQSEKDKNK